jgi:hypothetical protein
MHQNRRLCQFWLLYQLRALLVASCRLVFHLKHPPNICHARRYLWHADNAFSYIFSTISCISSEQDGGATVLHLYRTNTRPGRNTAASFLRPGELRVESDLQGISDYGTNPLPYVLHPPLSYSIA